MNRTLKLFSFLFLAVVVLTAQTVTFTTAPAFSKDGSNKWWVEFTVSQNTDVEVSIVRLKDSSVVRHLAAGMLGAAAPAPLAAGSLSQKLEWDVKDDLGRVVAAPESLSARVRAGMSVSLAGMVGSNPYAFNGMGDGYYQVNGLALDDSDGSIYVYGTATSLRALTIRKYDAVGNHIKTIFPYPAGLDAAQVRGFGTVDRPNGRYTPFTTCFSSPNISKTIVTSMTSTLWPQVTGGEIRIGSTPTLNYLKVKTTGEIVGTGSTQNLVTSPAFPGGSAAHYYLGGPTFVRVSPDKKFVYLSGIYEGVFISGVPVVLPDTGFWTDGQVFKVDLTTGVATSWLKLDSIPKTTVERQKTIGPFDTVYSGLRDFAAIHGTAWDDSGHVFICDRFHKRIGVYDTNANYLGGISVTDPDIVEVDGKTGAIYVVTRRLTGYHVGDVSILKYSGWRNGGTLAASLPHFVMNVGEKFGSPYSEKVYMVVSKSGPKPVIWFTSYSSAFDPTENNVWAIQDDGNALTVIKDFYQLSSGTNVGYDRIAVDRRNETVYINDGWSGLFKVEDWSNPKVVRCSTSTGKRLLAGDIAISPNNLLYAREDLKATSGGGYSGPITRYTLDHRHAPANFGSTGSNTLLADVYGRFGAGYADRGLAVFRDGRVAVMYQSGFALYWAKVFDSTGAELVKFDPIAQKCGGVHFDMNGDLYFGLFMRTATHQYPAGFSAADCYLHSVGSVVKFPSTQNGCYTDVPGVGTDANIKAYGAKKVYDKGLAPYSWTYAGYDGCACRTPRFDVDPYGRIFIPNAISGQVTVVDNSDNTIVQFGEYGNMDSRGQGSLVPTPDIPLAWPIAAAVTDDYIYVNDLVNARLVRIKMNYVLDNYPGLTQGVSVSKAPLKVSLQPVLAAAPNPFSAPGVIKVYLPGRSRMALDVYDLSGRLVRNISAGELESGVHGFTWDGKAAGGQMVAAGTYFYRLTLGTRMLTEKVILAK